MPAKTVGIEFPVAPHAEHERVLLDSRGFDKYMVIFPQVRTKLDGNEFGKQGLVDDQGFT